MKDRASRTHKTPAASQKSCGELGGAARKSPGDNNNDHEFDCKYDQRHGAGHLSDGASSTSSSPASDEERLSSESLSYTSSGRSSANQSESLADVGANAVPESEAALKLMDQVRVRFLESVAQHPADDFDPRDLEALQAPLSSSSGGQVYRSISVRFIARYLRFEELLADEHEREKPICEAADKLREFLQFRHRYQLEDALPEQFCKEMHQLHGIFPFGCDRNGLPVLYLRARVHRRWSHPLNESFKRYVAWQVNLLTKSYHSAQVKSGALEGRRDVKDGSFGIYFDCLNVSYACVDMDFLSYLVKILVNYYPTYCRYALCIDLPWLFRSVWRLVRSWLPEEAQSTVHLITSKQLTEFIDEDQIPNSMKINVTRESKESARGKHKMPANVNELKNIDDFAKELGLSSSELKQFKSHVEKVLKEYEQLGAI